MAKQKLQHPVKLGQRVYAVSLDGTITATFISSIAVDTSRVAREMGFVVDIEMCDAWSHTAVTDDHMVLTFYPLDSADVQARCFTDFSMALTLARAALIDRVCDTTLSLKELSVVQDQLQKYTHEAKTLLANLQAVDSVVPIRKRGTVLRNEGVSPVGPEAFPKHYFEIGTPVWIADTQKYRRIKGVIREVNFVPSSGQVRYTCGSHTNLPSDVVFASQGAATRCLKEHFARTHKGHLDLKQVETVNEISQAELKATRRAQFEKIADRQSRRGGVDELEL